MPTLYDLPKETLHGVFDHLDAKGLSLTRLASRRLAAEVVDYGALKRFTHTFATADYFEKVDRKAQVSSGIKKVDRAVRALRAAHLDKRFDPVRVPVKPLDAHSQERVGIWDVSLVHIERTMDYVRGTAVVAVVNQLTIQVPQGDPIQDIIGEERGWHAPKLDKVFLAPLPQRGFACFGVSKNPPIAYAKVFDGSKENRWHFHFLGNDAKPSLARLGTDALWKVTSDHSIVLFTSDAWQPLWNLHPCCPPSCGAEDPRLDNPYARAPVPAWWRQRAISDHADE